MRRHDRWPAPGGTAAGSGGAARGEQGGDWPGFLGPNRNGHSTEKDLADRWSDKGPAVLWEQKVGEGFSGPVVAEGTVYLFHRVGEDEVLEAFEAGTGKSRWKVAYPCEYRDAYGKGNGPRATPVIQGDRLYCLGVTGVLSCLDIKGGKKEVWRKELGKEYTLQPSFFGVGSTPLLEGDLLLLNLGAEKAGIIALQRHTGKEVWRATEDEASYSSPVAATVDGVRHVFFLTREGLVSVDPVTGKVRFSKRWRSRMGASVNAATPILVGKDQLFITASYGTGAGLFRIKKDDAEVVWKSDKVLSAHFTTPVAVGGLLFGVDGRQEVGAQLRCIEWETGKVRWTEAGFGCGSLVAVGDRLLLLSEGGDLILVGVNGEKYEERARVQILRGPVRAAPALAEGRLYARDNGRLVCVELKKK